MCWTGSTYRLLGYVELPRFLEHFAICHPQGGWDLLSYSVWVSGNRLMSAAGAGCRRL